MNITINYQTNNNPSFAGTVNMQKLRELMKQVEPEAIKKITKRSMEDFAREWVNIPNPKLDALFYCHDLNLNLKRMNIEALLEKRGFSSKDIFFNDIKHNVTHSNYDLAVLFAKDESMSLIEIRSILGKINEDKMSLEDAFAQFRKTHNTSSSYRTSEKFGEDFTKQTSENQSTKRQNGWTKEQFITHIQQKIEKRRFTILDLKDSEVRNLAKLFGTTEEQIRNMDKQEYRRLSLKFHPDSAGTGKEDIFWILNSLYNSK